MRLRGLVFERLAAFERAEASFCDDSGAPLDAIVLVGESGAGKSAFLRAIAGVLAEAAGSPPELTASDIRRGATDARLRVVLDDMVDDERVIVTLEKELTEKTGRLKGSPPEKFDRWVEALAKSEQPRAAFSVAPADEGDDEEEDDTEITSDAPEPESLFQWLVGVPRNRVKPALDRVLWPYVYEHMDDGQLFFETPSGIASATELGEGFESMLVMTLELLRLTLNRTGAELVYVIDDIDAHLHPKWQSRILGDFKRAFPGVQLVVSTHSPYVVASVEPTHVFRVEASGLSRLSDRLQKGSPVSSIMDAAFSAPDLPGPRWAHAPTLAVRTDVLAQLEAELGRGSVVYVLPEPTHARDIRDAFGEPALPNAESATGWVFFIDREPGTAWGHPCEYVFRGPDGQLARRRAIWPPQGLERFVPIGRG